LLVLALLLALSTPGCMFVSYRYFEDAEPPPYLYPSLRQDELPVYEDRSPAAYVGEQISDNFLIGLFVAGPAVLLDSITTAILDTALLPIDIIRLGWRETSPELVPFREDEHRVALKLTDRQIAALQFYNEARITLERALPLGAPPTEGSTMLGKEGEPRGERLVIRARTPGRAKVEGEDTLFVAFDVRHPERQLAFVRKADYYRLRTTPPGSSKQQYAGKEWKVVQGLGTRLLVARIEPEAVAEEVLPGYPASVDEAMAHR
jgi:hypothetical protein